MTAIGTVAGLMTGVLRAVCNLSPRVVPTCTGNGVFTDFSPHTSLLAFSKKDYYLQIAIKASSLSLNSPRFRVERFAAANATSRCSKQNLLLPTT